MTAEILPDVIESASGVFLKERENWLDKLVTSVYDEIRLTRAFFVVDS